VQVAHVDRAWRVLRQDLQTGRGGGDGIESLGRLDPDLEEGAPRRVLLAQGDRVEGVRTGGALLGRDPQAQDRQVVDAGEEAHRGSQPSAESTRKFSSRPK
jgi:hypothetical protein